jgi:hypothetical protein
MVMRRMAPSSLCCVCFPFHFAECQPCNFISELISHRSKWSCLSKVPVVLRLTGECRGRLNCRQWGTVVHFVIFSSYQGCFFNDACHLYCVAIAPSAKVIVTCRRFARKRFCSGAAPSLSVSRDDVRHACQYSVPGRLQGWQRCAVFWYWCCPLYLLNDAISRSSFSVSKYRVLVVSRR